MPAVVFCSGFAPPAAVSKVVADGGLHCLLAKPVTADQLVSTVKSRLD
jgi:hypothetical protein